MAEIHFLVTVSRCRRPEVRSKLRQVQMGKGSDLRPAISLMAEFVTDAEGNPVEPGVAMDAFDHLTLEELKAASDKFGDAVAEMRSLGRGRR